MASYDGPERRALRPEGNDRSAEFEPLLLRIQAACARLAIGRSTMYALIASGEVGTVRIGAARRVPVAELERYVRERTRRGR